MNVVELHKAAADPQIKPRDLGRESACRLLSSLPTTAVLHDYFTLENYLSGLSKSNFKDHYGDVVITQCLGKIAEINELSASDEMLWVTRQTGRQQVDCSKVEGRQ